MKQRRLPGVNLFIRKSYGGAGTKGKRKIKRPFSPKKLLHIVFRSDRAIGDLSMLNKRHEIELELLEAATTYAVKCEQFTNSGNHLHLLIQASSREKLQNFLRAFARRLAKVMVGPMKKFWTSLVYSRIVEWGRDRANVITYIVRNFLEVSGVILYQRSRPGGLRLLE